MLKHYLLNILFYVKLCAVKKIYIYISFIAGNVAEIILKCFCNSIPKSLAKVYPKAMQMQSVAPKRAREFSRGQNQAQSEVSDY